MDAYAHARAPAPAPAPSMVMDVKERIMDVKERVSGRTVRTQPAAPSVALAHRIA